MNLHQAMVLYTGTIYCLIGLTILVAWKVLGPSYEDHLTFGWRVRLPLFVAGIAGFIQGIVILFPGRLVHTENMSPTRTLWATALFAAVLNCTEFLASRRAPPPVMQRLQRAFEIMAGSRDSELVEAAMTLPAAAIGEPPPAEPRAARFANPHLRRWIIGVATVALVLIFVVVLHAAATPLPR